MIRKLVGLASVTLSFLALSGGPALAASPMPVYRLYNPTIRQHLQTIDASEATRLAGSGWMSETSTFQALPTNGGSCDSGTVAVYRLYNPADYDHLLTADSNEETVLAQQIINKFGQRVSVNNWYFEGVAFCAYSTQVAGTKPVYRLDSPNPSGREHFLTADTNEVNALTAVAGGWTKEANGNNGIAFYAN